LQNSSTIHTSCRGLPSSHTSTSCTAHHSITQQGEAQHRMPWPAHSSSLLYGKKLQSCESTGRSSAPVHSHNMMLGWLSLWCSSNCTQRTLLPCPCTHKTTTILSHKATLLLRTGTAAYLSNGYAVATHLSTHIKHGHNVGVAEPVVQQRLQAAAGVEVARHLLQHLDSNQGAVPVACKATASGRQQAAARTIGENN
jgi:hypothetical protein